MEDFLVHEHSTSHLVGPTASDAPQIRIVEGYRRNFFRIRFAAGFNLHVTLVNKKKKKLRHSDKTFF